MTYKRREDNSGFHIDRIIDSVPCTTHGADIQDSCWTIYSIHGPLRAICDRRARLAGANGKITPYIKKAYSKKETNA